MKITVRNGLIIAAIVIVLKLIVAMAHLEKVDFTGILIVVAFIYFIYNAGMAIRHEQHNVLTYGQGFNAGMSVTFWASLVSAVLMYTVYKFIDHETVKMVQQQIPTILDKQNVPDDQRQTIQDTMSRIFGPGGLAIVDFIKYVLLGLIVSLIVAAIIKRGPLPSDPYPEYREGEGEDRG